MAEDLAIAPLMRRKTGGLSAGQKTRVALAKAMLIEAEKRAKEAKRLERERKEKEEEQKEEGGGREEEMKEEGRRERGRG